MELCVQVSYSSKLTKLSWELVASPIVILLFPLAQTQAGKNRKEPPDSHGIPVCSLTSCIIVNPSAQVKITLSLSPSQGQYCK